MTSKVITVNRFTDAELANLAFYAGESICHPDPNYRMEFEKLAFPGAVLSLVEELQERRKADKPPAHPTIASEHLDDETLQDLIEFRRSTFEYHSKEGHEVQTILHGVILSALAELQERRKADSEPVAWTSEEAIAEVYCDETGMIGPKYMVGDVPLYRHTQPTPDHSVNANEMVAPTA